MFRPKCKNSCHPQHYRVRFFSLLSDSALSLCRLFLVKHVEMHNLFEIILEIEDRATGAEDAGCSCILTRHSVSLCSGCTGAGIKEEEEKSIFKLFFASACWGKLKEP